MTVSAKIYEKQDHIDFKCFNFHFLDRDVSRFQSYGIYKYIYPQSSRFANVCSYDSGIKIEIHIRLLKYT